jgi:hypothetical protein
VIQKKIFKQKNLNYVQERNHRRKIFLFIYLLIHSSIIYLLNIHRKYFFFVDRLEEVLPKQYHQSRRNLSKSSTIGRSLSPQGGKLLILRPTLPFHHSDAVNVQRVCLQYAIDLIPNENFTSAALATNRNNKPNSLKHPEQPNNLPMIGAPLTSMNPTMGKSSSKDKASSNRSDDYIHPRRNGGAV